LRFTSYFQLLSNGGLPDCFGGRADDGACDGGGVFYCSFEQNIF
jgi:hypothetical protein